MPPTSAARDTIATTAVSATLVLPQPLPTIAPVTTTAATAATSSTTARPPSPPPVTTEQAAPTTTPAATSVTTSSDCLASIPLRIRLAQLVWPAVYGDALRTSATDFASWGVGGAVVMTFPAGAGADDLLQFKLAGAVPLLLATDEEGGKVQRFRSLGALPAPARVARSMSVTDAEAMIAEHAATLASVGIDVVFAPVLDVQPDGSPGPIGDRSFGSDPMVVEAYAAAYVAGWESAGIMPVLKHFPGHGSATGDTHDGFASTLSLDELRGRDLLPYAALATSGAGVMVGHLDVPGLTEPGLPASLSPAAITRLLRDEYGYRDALVFSDALGMDAVTQRYSLAQAAELALVAGDDVVIFTATEQAPAVIDRLVAAVEAGRLTERRVDEALTRVLRAKRLDACAMAVAVR
jgi:beta-N-acetylhexosaminidase